MPTLTTNVSFQKWADNEEPWEQRTDWDKLDDIFSGVTTVPGFDVTTLTADDLTINNQGSRGIKNSTEDIGSGAATDISIDVADYEDSEVVTVDTTNDDLEVLQAGRYQIDGQVNYSESMGDGTRVSEFIRINGSAVAEIDTVLGGSVNPALNLSTTKELSANDKVSLAVFHDHGANRLLAGDERGGALAVNVASQ